MKCRFYRAGIGDALSKVEGDAVMKWAMRVGKCRAFTLVDLAVVLATVAMLLMLLPALARSKSYGCRVRCTSNLKQIGLAFRGFAQDWDGVYPFQTKNVTNYIGTPPGGTLVSGNANASDLWMHFQMLSNELNTARVLMCPMDRSRLNFTAEEFSANAAPRGFAEATARNKALSYFYGINADETKPNLILIGDRHVTPSRQSTLYSSRRSGGGVRVPVSSGWSGALHTNMGNICLADGSVQQVNSSQIRSYLQVAETTHGTNANLILFPQ